MLTKLIIRNFKRFSEAEIELGNPVVFVGPNNSGKTTALQALALWDIGLKRWNEKRAEREVPEKRPGVTINRRDCLALPVPDANLLWRQLHVRDVQRVPSKDTAGKWQPKTQNVLIDIRVEGVSNGEYWVCGLEFDYANNESFYCRPSRVTEDGQERMKVPGEAGKVKVAFLPPMSGLASNETRLDSGAINVRLGEGRTAEVLRNLCYQVAQDGTPRWRELCSEIERLFGVRLDEPKYVEQRGEITMTYSDQDLGSDAKRLDLSSAGRGLQQTLLVLAHLMANPGSVILIDEPDAHLEILRQRQTYDLLCRHAEASQSQIVIASHSEVVLDEAADRDVVVAFVGKPHRLNDRSQLQKSLRTIGFEQFLQAEQTGWVLYLEGSTDLAVLKSFAAVLEHPASTALQRPFVYYVGNQPRKARDHFFGLQEAKYNLVGFALFDRLDQPLQDHDALVERMWPRREIENYLYCRDSLIYWATRACSDLGPGKLFANNWAQTMEDSISEIEHAMAVLGRGVPWSPDTKATDDFLDPLFAKFFEKVGLPNLFLKRDYHVLAEFMPKEEISPEVSEMLDRIHETAQRAKPLE